ncbi:MAG: hypothetical protein Tsb008_12360 [Rhodothalassiaceae bacterium]
MERDRISDETLGAYVDGELAQGEAEALTLREASDPDFRARVAAHRRLRSAIADAYAEDLAEPVPARLLDAARGRREDGGKILAFGRRTGLGATPIRVAMALAASLVLGIAIGRIAFSPAGTEPLMIAGADGPMAAGALDALLETSPSGIANASGDRAIFSYARADGSHCRVFALGDAALFGLACRSNKGWAIAALEPRPHTESGTEAGIRPAGSEPLPPAIRDLIAREKMGDPLGAEAEAAALGRGWQDGTRE